MNSPQSNSEKVTEPGLPRSSADPAATELVLDGLGLPHLSRQPADHASDSELGPVADSVDIDDGINADKAAAESQAAAAKAKTQGK